VIAAGGRDHVDRLGRREESGLSGALVGGALDWAGRASLPVADLEDTATVRLALAACARSLTGKAAAGSAQRRKWSAFHNAFGYAVEQGHLASNTVDRIQWTNPAVAQSVDRRVVVSPAQARKLLAAVRGHSERGQHLEAFFACLYYAALRPSEAVMLRESHLYLPFARQTTASTNSRSFSGAWLSSLNSTSYDSPSSMHWATRSGRPSSRPNGVCMASSSLDLSALISATWVIVVSKFDIYRRALISALCLRGQSRAYGAG
jgi:hypothetical protein